jgi:hypothetical protein
MPTPADPATTAKRNRDLSERVLYKFDDVGDRMAMHTRMEHLRGRMDQLTRSIDQRDAVHVETGADGVEVRRTRNAFFLTGPKGRLDVDSETVSRCGGDAGITGTSVVTLRTEGMRPMRFEEPVLATHSNAMLDPIPLDKFQRWFKRIADADPYLLQPDTGCNDDATWRPQAAIALAVLLPLCDAPESDDIALTITANTGYLDPMRAKMWSRASSREILSRWAGEAWKTIFPPTRVLTFGGQVHEPKTGETVEVYRIGADEMYVLKVDVPDLDPVEMLRRMGPYIDGGEPFDAAEIEAFLTRA